MFFMRNMYSTPSVCVCFSQTNVIACANSRKQYLYVEASLTIERMENFYDDVAYAVSSIEFYDFRNGNIICELVTWITTSAHVTVCTLYVGRYILAAEPQSSINHLFGTIALSYMRMIFIYPLSNFVYVKSSENFIVTCCCRTCWTTYRFAMYLRHLKSESNIF